MTSLMFTLALAMALTSAPNHVDEDPPNAWTLMFYGGGNNSCEDTIMNDLRNMKESIVDNQGLTLIVHIDRMKGHSEDAEAFGENFEDTRLYRIRHNSVERLDGGDIYPEITKTSNFDANQGSAETVGKFIRFCKANYPARHYGLIFYSHGNGWSMCADSDSGRDALMAGELTEHLSEEEAVDLMAFDVCSMGGIENAYEWCPDRGGFHAEVMVASASVSRPWPYDRILSPLKNGSDLDPQTLSPQELGTHIVKCSEVMLREGLEANRGHHRMLSMLNRESWACLDLNVASEVKSAVDELATHLYRQDAKEIVEAIRGEPKKLRTMNYTHEEDDLIEMPYFDLFDLALRLQSCESLDASARSAASSVCDAVSELVVFSYGLAHYSDFVGGDNGCFIAFPDGDGLDPAGVKAWNRITWYNPDASEGNERYRARYAWCTETNDDDMVDTWFELMAAWYGAASSSDPKD